MGTKFLENLHSIKHTGNNLTMKQMFDISENLIVGQSDEIYGVNTINWDDSSWKHYFLIGDEEVISLSHAKVYVFSDSVLCLRKMNENPQSHTVWEDKLTWFKSSSQYRPLDTIDGEPMEFEWNIFPGFTTLQLCNKVQEFLSTTSEEPEKFTGRIIFTSMFNDISRRSQDNEQECELSANLVTPRTSIRKEDNLTHCSRKLIDNDTRTFDWVSCTRRSNAKSTKNEWKGYHNKIVWLSFVLMQDFRQTEDTEEFSQFTDAVACREFAKRWKLIWLERLDSREHQKLDPYWKSQPATHKVNMEWKLKVNLQTKTIRTRGSGISHGLNKLVTDLSNNKEDDNNEQETSEMQFNDFALKTNVHAFASRTKAEQNHRYVLLPTHPQELYPSWKELGLSQKIIRPSLTQCQNRVLFFVMVIYLEKKMERLNSGE